MCKTPSSHGHHVHHSEGCRCGCSCCGGGPSVRRRYLSSKERKDMLEKYREELKNELQGLDEEIARIG